MMNDRQQARKKRLPLGETVERRAADSWKDPIPDELLACYEGLKPWESFYLRARWRACPLGRIEEALPLKGNIVEIGCGAGLLSNLLGMRSRDRKVTGIDSSPSRLAVASKSINQDRNVRFILGDALQHPLSFPDAIVIGDVLHHVPFADQEKLFRRIRLSLLPGGLLVIQDISFEPRAKYLFGLAVDKVMNRLAKVYYRSASEWTGLLRESGFEVEARPIGAGYPIAAVLFQCRRPA